MKSNHTNMIGICYKENSDKCNNKKKYTFLNTKCIYDNAFIRCAINPADSIHHTIYLIKYVDKQRKN